MADSEKSIADEAKGFSQEIVATLGLVELILGAVALYGISLILRDSSMNSLFPSTGNSVVDVGLQLFAAALIGKIIYLIVAFPIGFVRFRMRKNSSYCDPLKNALEKFYDDTTLTEIVQGKNYLIDTAIKHISISDAYQRVAFERHRIKIIVAYGTSVLILIFFIHFSFFSQQTPSSILLIFLGAAFFVFIFLGVLEQRSLVSEATQTLIALHKVEERKKAEEQKKELNSKSNNTTSYIHVRFL